MEQNQLTRVDIASTARCFWQKPLVYILSKMCISRSNNVREKLGAPRCFASLKKKGKKPGEELASAGTEKVQKLWYYYTSLCHIMTKQRYRREINSGENNHLWIYVFPIEEYLKPQAFVINVCFPFFSAYTHKDSEKLQADLRGSQFIRLNRTRKDSAHNHVGQNLPLWKQKSFYIQAGTGQW